jgi:hypothetical protein
VNNLTFVTIKSSKKISRVNMDGVGIQRFGHYLRLDHQGVYMMSILATHYIYVHGICSWLSQSGNNERSQTFFRLMSFRKFTSMQQKYWASAVLGPYCRPLHSLAPFYPF